MDLYEALKGGTDAKTLLDTFQKELDAAQERIVKEEVEKKRQEKAEKKELLTTARAQLAESLTEYISIVLDDEDFYSSENVKLCEDILTEVETETKGLLLLSTLENKRKKPTLNIVRNNKDDDIINRFLETLK